MIGTIPDFIIISSLVINVASKYKAVATINLSCISSAFSISSAVFKISTSMVLYQNFYSEEIN